MARVILLVVVVAISAASCSEDELHGKNFEYNVYNQSDIDLGIKVTLAVSSSGAALVKEAFTLKPGEEITFMKAAEQKEPGAYIQSLEVLDKDLTQTYRLVDLASRQVDGNVTRLGVWMPSPRAREIAINNTGVIIYADETSIYGFFPRDELGTGSYFFRSNDDLKTIVKSMLPPETTGYDITGEFGNTIVANDRMAYSASTSFIVSNNKGQSWSPMFSVFNGNNADFMTADIISPSEGWFFTYHYWDSTRTFRFDGNSYVRQSRLREYCVQHARFFSSSTGYVVANTKNNVSPSDSPNAYLFATTDGGASWSQPVEISTTESPLKFFAFPSGDFFVMRTNYFEMHKSYYHSGDFGATWQLVETGIEGKIRDMQFISEDIGFIKTGTNSLWSQTTYGFVYKTTDGGKTWHKIPSVDLPGSRIHFYNEKVGVMQDLIYGEGQILLVTRDGGVTWKELMYPYDYLKAD